MDLKFLGRGAAFNPSEGNTSAFLREESRFLLLDCGESVFARIHRCGVLEGVREADVCITHLHADHVGSLSSFLLYCHYILGITPRVILPAGVSEYREDIVQLLRINGCPEGFYAVGEDAELLGYAAFSSLRYVPTPHCAELKYSFSLAFETPEGGVFYSGDACSAEALSAFLAEHPAPEQLYVDATTADFPGNVHLSLRLLGEAVPEEKRCFVSIMHLNNASCEAEGQKLGFRSVQVI